MKNEQFLDTFKEEAYELLENLESTLLELEEHPQDQELLSAVFRVMHTIKGSAAMFGLDSISSFAHEVESILSALRDGIIFVTKDLIGNTLLSRDYILEMLQNISEADKPLPENLNSFLKNFKKIVGLGLEESKGASSDSSEVLEKEKNLAEDSSVSVQKPSATWHIIFSPYPELFKRGGNPIGIINELQSLGELVIIPIFDKVTPLSSFDPEENKTSWDLYLKTTVSENEIRDVFIFVEDIADITIENLEIQIDENTKTKKLGEILIDSGRVKKKEFEKLLQKQRRIGEILLENKLVSKTDLKRALEEQKQVQNIQKAKIALTDMSTIRVKSDKLDLLMSLVGELVTVHAQILDTSKNLHNDELVTVVEQFGRLTDELRNNTMSIRMVPIGTTFSSFKRLVRDLSEELGKKIDLETEGGDTELDKTVIEKLGDPLVHLIRNSIDHGIESPDLRKERGKNEVGLIRLNAIQTGASVYIEIIDDGNGLEKEKILAKAIKNGIVSESEALTDEEIYKLIFAPGFSTKEKVSAVSGRGVGMDVVKKQLEAINGSIDIKSETQRGTKISLKIPLTLAIIDGLLVTIEDCFYVIPLSVVVACIEFKQSSKTNEHDIVIYQGKQVPYINMRRYFNNTDAHKAIEQIVIVRIKDRHIGLLVDQVIGGNQTVIKPLGKLFKQTEGISSGTILGDGSVALILDVEQIVNYLEMSIE